jgi:ABC-2 type transport system permease protein
MTRVTRTPQVLPVAGLTLRQFLGGRAVGVAVVLALLPLAFALIYLVRPEMEQPTIFLGNVIFLELMVPTLLPLAVLVLATGALGHEVEDRTLHYLTLQPISRLRIVLEKLLASVVVSSALLTLGIVLTYFIVMRGDAGESFRLLWAMVGASLIAALAYSSIFMLVSLLVSRPLLVALVYALLWESLLGRFVPGLRYVSIRHFVASLYVDLAQEPGISVPHATGMSAAIATLVIASAIALALATWRLRTMNLG